MVVGKPRRKRRKDSSSSSSSKDKRGVPWRTLATLRSLLFHRRKDNSDTNLMEIVVVGCAHHWLSIVSVKGCGLTYRSFYQFTGCICHCIRFSSNNCYFWQGKISCVFTELRVSSPCSSVLNPVLTMLNPVHTFHTVNSRSTLRMYYHLLLGILIGLLWHFTNQNLYFFFPRECFISHPSHLFLDIITLTVWSEECKQRSSSLCNFLHLSVAASKS
jgi:hypothetical protein